MLHPHSPVHGHLHEPGDEGLQQCVQLVVGGRLRSKWPEFDLDAAQRVLLAERMKMGKALRVFLSRQAVEILRQVKERTEDDEYVFPSSFRGSVPMGSMTLNHFFKRIDFGVPDFSPHGTRDTAATLLRELGNDHQFGKFCALNGRPEVATDPRFVALAQRIGHRRELFPLLAEWMLMRTTAEWTALLEPQGVPCAPILELPAVFRHPQVVSRGMQVSHGSLPMVGMPMRFDSQRPVAEQAPPQLDEHGAVVRDALKRGGGWQSA